MHAARADRALHDVSRSEPAGSAADRAGAFYSLATAGNQVIPPVRPGRRLICPVCRRPRGAGYLDTPFCDVTCFEDHHDRLENQG